MGKFFYLEARKDVLYSQGSVVDPNTLNLDPDPGFWPDLDPDPGLFNQFWKKKFKIILEKLIFYETSMVFYEL